MFQILGGLFGEAPIISVRTCFSLLLFVVWDTKDNEDDDDDEDNDAVSSIVATADTLL